MTTREVVLDGGSPWGFRLHGGADVNQPLRISRVNPGSKAALRGIREGDLITSINNRSTKDITNAEAHSLLRNSGDTLKLGLNEDCSGSPKRRQYKTVHQETHSETVKKSSITSYTLTSSKTVSQTEISNNEQKTSNVNGNCADINGDSVGNHTKHPVVSQRSTLSSNCSSSSSTSTYTDPSASPEMPDRRRKRSRNQRRKTKTNLVQSSSVEIIEEENVETDAKAEYRVESPKTVKSANKTTPVKSKSLDDDDLIKIQELSETSEGEDRSECKAIVSEAESDVEWEITGSMEEPELKMGVLSSLSLPLESYTTEEVSLLSPEEELTLRNFLEGLNLVNSPEDAAKKAHEVSTMESVKSRRAKKRAVLEQYFNPIIQNPRYLDVISEETSDLSDREQSMTHHLKQGTPEPPEVPKLPPKGRDPARLQSRMQSHFPAPISNPTILVGTKIIDMPVVGHGMCSTTSAPPSDKAEVVFLEDSSNSTTPDPSSDNEEEKQLVSSNDSSVLDLLDQQGKNEAKESETVEEKKQICVSVKKDDVVVSTSDCLEVKQQISDGGVLIPKVEQEIVPSHQEEDLVKVTEDIVSTTNCSVGENKYSINKSVEDSFQKSEESFREEKERETEAVKTVRQPFGEEKGKSEEDIKEKGVEFDLNANKYTPTKMLEKNYSLEKFDADPLKAFFEETKQEVKTLEENKMVENVQQKTTNIVTKKEVEKGQRSFAEYADNVNKPIFEKYTEFNKSIANKLQIPKTTTIITTAVEEKGNKNEEIFEKSHEQESEKIFVESGKIEKDAVLMEQKKKSKRLETFQGFLQQKNSTAVTPDTQKTEKIIPITIETTEIKKNENFHNTYRPEIKPKPSIRRNIIKVVAEEQENTNEEKKISAADKVSSQKVERIIPVSIEGIEHKSDDVSKKQENISSKIKSEPLQTERLIKVSVENRRPRNEDTFQTFHQQGNISAGIKPSAQKTEKIIPISIENREQKKEESPHFSSESKSVPTKAERIIKMSVEKEEHKNETTSQKLYQQKVNEQDHQKIEKIIPISIEGSDGKKEETSNKLYQQPVLTKSEPSKTKNNFKMSVESKNEKIIHRINQQENIIEANKSEKHNVEKIIPISIEESTQKDGVSQKAHHQEITPSVIKPESPKTERTIKIVVEGRENKDNENFHQQKNILTPNKSNIQENEKIIPISVETREKNNEENVSSESNKGPLKTEKVIQKSIEKKEHEIKNIFQKFHEQKTISASTKSETQKKEKIIPMSIEKRENKKEENFQKPYQHENIFLEMIREPSLTEKITKMSVDEKEHKTENIFQRFHQQKDISATVKSDTQEREKIIPISIETRESKRQENIQQENIFTESIQRPLKNENFIKKSFEEKERKTEETFQRFHQQNKVSTPENQKTERIIPILVEKTEKNNENTFSPTHHEKTCTGNNQKSPETKETFEKLHEQEIKVKTEEKETKIEKTEKLTEPSPSKEIETICSTMKTVYTNALSPSSPSPSWSSGSSSRATSLCTAKYNPMTSSIADIESISEDLKKFQPLTLRELCLNFLLSKPYGADVLQELSEVSQSIEALTSKLFTDSQPLMPPTRNPELEKPLDVEHINRASYHHECNVESRSKNASIKDTNQRLLAIIRDDEASTDMDRLRAKDLNEWLRLARSTSLSNLTEATSETNMRRRTSLPQDFYEQQMRYLQEKEMEIQRELEHLEDEKRKLTAEMAPTRNFDLDDFRISKKGDFAEIRKQRPISMPSTEVFRQQMYEEYMNQIAKREERKQHKVIKVTSIQKSTETSKAAGIEDEFMNRVKEKQKLGKLLREETEEQKVEEEEQKAEEEPVLVMDGESLKGATVLPPHLREFVDLTSRAEDERSGNIKCKKCNKEARRISRALSKNRPQEKSLLHEIDSGLVLAKGFLLCRGVWSPGQKQQDSKVQEREKEKVEGKDDPISPVWTPKSATSSPTVERKEFKPVKFESPVLNRKSYNKIEEPPSEEFSSREPPWKAPETSSDTGLVLSSTLQKRLPTSHSSPASGFNDFSTTRLPKAQNPTITLLQKAREGQLPKGALYIEQDPSKRPQNEKPPLVGPGEILYKIKNEYTSESDSEKPRKMVDLGPRKFEGIGPTTKDGMPLILRSEVKDANQSKWYKKMYDTIHKQRPHKDEFVTVRYKQRRGQYPYTSGYLSEPEPGAYDSDHTAYKYATLDRRRVPARDRENDYMSSTMPRTEHKGSDVIKHGHDPYKNQPGRIENYIPGHSSISDKEAKEWWDEVMDIFDGWLDDNSALPSYDYMFSRALAKSHLEQQKRVPQTKSFINQALKESGYESDSTLVFRRRDDTVQQLSPSEQKEAYKIIQKGGDIPLHGLRKPAPERPKAETELEYFPISPTLTRIRIHKNIKPQTEILCYPVTIPPHPPTVFGQVKRTAPSAVTKPPSPPRRRSSRNNSTLRLISTMKVKTEKLPVCKRHETCFTTTSNVDSTNVKYLRDKITCKLSPVRSKDGKEVKPKVKVSKFVTSTPDMKSKIVSTVTTGKDSKTVTSKVQSRTNITRSSDKCCTATGRSLSTGSIRKVCKKCAAAKTESEKPRPGTFGVEKKKVDLVLPKIKTKSTLVNSPDLLSPTEVKKAVQTQARNLPSGTVFKKSSALLSSVRNGTASSSKDATIPIKVGISEKGKTILKSSIQKPSSPQLSKATPSTSYAKPSSIESLKSPVSSRKVIVSTVGKTAPSKSSKSLKTKSSVSTTEARKLKKSKKEEINGEIAKKGDKIGKEVVSVDRLKKCAGRAAGTEIVKKLREMEDSSEFGSTDTLTDIQRQKEAIQTDYFFQHLFLRDLPSPTPSMSSKYSWLVERAYQLQRRRSSTSEPTISAMKLYLKHTKPVTDSKFRSLDVALVRSRSASPKSVTWETSPVEKIEKRSSSLPPKLVFSQTSRPVSPKVEKRRSPPASPRALRSPSSRRIMHFRSQPQTIERLQDSRSSSPRSKNEITLYACPSLSQSTSSIDSYDRKEYQTYVKELVRSSKKSSRFKDLNEFYSAIEKFGQLEQTASLKPRTKSEDEIIDYDRWREVRTRERAEKELKTLVTRLKENAKEKGFLFCPKEVDAYRWKKELDRGLRVKEKSVENIKEAFEKLKEEESERESAKRRELAALKDTYKPLWRGDSVLSLAHRMTERRSQSEGRVASARQKLIDSERMLTHGIGSRLWSSLSSEQVNILKNQLSEIYSQNLQKQKKEPLEYTIQVPEEKTHYCSTLTVRRNSDTSDYLYKTGDAMSESDKKVISQTIGKEVLDHVSKRKTVLPLVQAKETRGAIAAAGAFSMSKSCPPDLLKDTKCVKDEEEEPSKALVKTDATSPPKIASETESGSTDESTKTVIYTGKKEEIKKKVEYFENVAEQEKYTPTVYKPSESHYDIGDLSSVGSKSPESSLKRHSITSRSYQDMKEFFGEQELMKLATVPLSATRKQVYSSPERPQLRAMRVPSPPISETTSNDSFSRSRSLSPYSEEPLALVKAGEVRRLKNKFERDPFPVILKPRRCRSDSNLYKYKQICIPGQSVELLRSKYEYPAHVGRGRSRMRRGGVVSPTFLRAEDRFMPHINIISKIANLYAKKTTTDEKSRSTEELAKLLGCPVGEVEKLRQKFDAYSKDISLLGHMFTSSPNIKELKDIAPYLAASWIAHRYPRTEDNTRSLSSPESSVASRDTSMVRRDRQRPKSTSPVPKKSSILKQQQQQQQQREKFDAKNQPLYRYQPEPVRYKSWWTSTHTRPSVSFKEPEPPVPPPKGRHGVRNLQPESPRKYVENEVTIHYKTPVRQEIKEYLSEDELAYRQAEAMKKIYQEERRRKYLQVSKSLQELQDMTNRRHTDNFIPSQKSPIPLNRYDDFDELSPPVKPRPRSPEPRLIARALYNFVGQTARELTFRKGDLIYVRRQVDKNWYEGELNAMVGLFPVNYVEIVPYDTAKSTPRKSHEGQARAKYNFLAQTHLELSLAKGELVVITRRVDDNWFEGKIGGRKGIFPVSYVEVLIDPSDPPPPSSKPVAAPAAHSLLLNGSAGGKESMGSHSYTPSLAANQLTSSYHAKPVQVTGNGNYGSLSRSSAGKSPVNLALHIETQSEPVPYRALYKYLPQNDDELELLEGDTVYVLEKCDDGWYVGSSERTGAFGTFPGNYVEKI